MAQTESYTFTVHREDDGKMDFNLYGLPDDIVLSLKNICGWEYQKRLGRNSAASFREERAKQHDRHMQHCVQTGADPQQQFIDFPIN